jgi:uncharacterized protein (DUF488 family)
MALQATLTRNGSSTQLILPAQIRSKYGLEAGEHVDLEAREEGILIRRRIPRPSYSSEVWTIGYEERASAELCGELVALGIKQVVDVRELPLSRRPGFSKSVLADKLQSSGIVYRHLRDMGSPRELRHAYREDGDVTSFMSSYSTYLDSRQESFELLRALVLATKSAILCYEQDYQACHRSVLANRLVEAGFRVSHL